MTIIPPERDIFQSDARILVNPVNTKGVMGKGLAKQFLGMILTRYGKKAMTDYLDKYKEACATGALDVGRLTVWAAPDGKTIVNFPTKKDWRAPSEISYVEAGLKDLAERVLPAITAVVPGAKIAIPPLGCGLGGLDWGQVRPMIEKAMKGYDAQILDPPTSPPVSHPAPPPSKSYLGREERYHREAARVTLALREMGLDGESMDTLAGQCGSPDLLLRWMRGHLDPGHEHPERVQAFGEALAKADRLLDGLPKGAHVITPFHPAWKVLYPGDDIGDPVVAYGDSALLACQKLGADGAPTIYDTDGDELHGVRPTYNRREMKGHVLNLVEAVQGSGGEVPLVLVTGSASDGAGLAREAAAERKVRQIRCLPLPLDEVVRLCGPGTPIGRLAETGPRRDQVRALGMAYGGKASRERYAHEGTGDIFKIAIDNGDGTKSWGKVPYVGGLKAADMLTTADMLKAMGEDKRVGLFLAPLPATDRPAGGWSTASHMTDLAGRLSDNAVLVGVNRYDRSFELALDAKVRPIHMEYEPNERTIVMARDMPYTRRQEAGTDENGTRLVTRREVDGGAVAEWWGRSRQPKVMEYGRYDPCL